MKKIIFTGLLVVIQASFCLNIWSQDVSKDMAVRAALHYTNLHKADNYQSMERCAAAPQSCAMGFGSDTLMVEKVSLTGEAFMWLVPTTDGWYLISPTQKTTPVFAYYPTDIKPSFENFSPAARDLIETYEEYIAECLNSNEITAEQTIQAKWAEINSPNSTINLATSESSSSVAPLLKKKGIEVMWGQTGSTDDCNRNYNKFCPDITGSGADEQCYKAAVGCVAVAIAQIMWYWEWPYAAMIPTTPGGKVLDVHFYDWNTMPAFINILTPMTHINMIAGFLRDCGYAIDMDYGTSSSASDDDALDALKNRFKYSQNMQLKKKWLTSGWRNLLLSELQSGRPVYYAGHRDAKHGHAFVVEGYDAVTDKYYINFGWNGVDNAYVNIDEIPTHRGNYTLSQRMIIGIEPAPSCSDKYYDQSNWSGSPKFFAIHNGNITLSGVEMSNIEKGIIYSGSQVILKGGTKISSGSNVHIAIKQDIPCGSTQNTAEVLENGTSTNNDETASVQRKTKKYIPVHDIVIDHIAVYNISGQLLHIIYGADTHLSSLPSGFYVLQKHMADGSVVSETIAHIKP